MHGTRAQWANQRIDEAISEYAYGQYPSPWMAIIHLGIGVGGDT